MDTDNLAAKKRRRRKGRKGGLTMKYTKGRARHSVRAVPSTLDLQLSTDFNRQDAKNTKDPVN